MISSACVNVNVNNASSWFSTTIPFSRHESGNSMQIGLPDGNI